MGAALRAGLTLLCLAGCNQVLGLDPATRLDAAAIDGGPDAIDGPPPIDTVDADPSVCVDPTGMPDEDFDGRRDECDNCPHLRQTDGWLDGDGDGVGDACDPRLGMPDRIVFYTGFEDPLGFEAITDGAPGDWAIGGGRLRITGTTYQSPYLARFPLTTHSVTVATQATPREQPVPVSATSRSVGVWAAIDPADHTASPSGIIVETAQSWPPSGPARHFAHLVDAAQTGVFADSPDVAGLWEYDQPYQISVTCVAETSTCTGRVGFDQVEYPMPRSGLLLRPGAVGLRTFGTDAEFDYLIVIAPAP